MGGIWYNNLKSAACAAARSSCADALSRMDLRTLNYAKPQECGFVEAAALRGGGAWYNNLKAARLRGLRALYALMRFPHMGFENIEPCKPRQARFCLTAHGATV